MAHDRTNCIFGSLLTLALAVNFGCAAPVNGTTEATRQMLSGNATTPELANKAEQLSQLESDLAYGEYLGAECLICHQSGTSTTSIPGIHGRDADQIIIALLEYKYKVRENTTMISMAEHLSEEDIAALAAYFSSFSK